MAFPGARTVLAAAQEAGQRAATVMAGVVLMLICAGLLEGFVRELVEPRDARFAVGGSMLALWVGYFMFAGRRRA